MDAICSSTWTLSSAEIPTTAEFLMGVPGAGIEWGLGKMAVGLGYGVLVGNEANDIVNCINEFKSMACEVREAYMQLVKENNLG